MAEIVMPRLSDSMEEGTVLKWLKQIGDEIAIGDEIVEIETDKANMAYEADVEGTLTEIVAQEGETLPIGTVIARVGDSAEGSDRTTAGPVTEDDSLAHPRGSSPSAPPAEAAAETAEAPSDGASTDGESSEAEAAAQGPAAQAGAQAPPAQAEAGERVKASPVARRLAEEKGIDLAAIEGSGPGGRIVKKDVKAAASGGDAGAGVTRGAENGPGARPAGPVTEDDSLAHPRGSSPSAPPAGEAPSPETAKGQVAYEDLSKLQSTIARRMAESKATAPHFYLEAEIDMSRVVEARAAVKAEAKDGDVVPSFNDMVVKACALALREFPRANGAYRDGRFELYSRVNVGIAVAGQDALVVPTVFDADRKGLRQIATESRALAAKVRDGQITPPELSGGTFTVSNLGMYGIDAFAAVINAPQAGILAVGAIKERPAVRDGEIVPAHLMNVTLACDHRILYGADGAEFLARIRALLEEPLSLAL
ncbi:MAG TPA: dihydrolipoamide acetyltransferase family protein [Solirubrobacterales bacterium]|jgi:pyruvate dehydrogenase E2 component (dihydrolipoamide acetyltransferase)|nr:dihydrolipoamide acetyltransferase family protein [Solirubrobacterales bacterium]